MRGAPSTNRQSASAKPALALTPQRSDLFGKFLTEEDASLRLAACRGESFCWRLVVFAVAHHGPEYARKPTRERDDGHAVTATLFDSGGPLAQVRARGATMVQHTERGLDEERPDPWWTGLG